MWWTSFYFDTHDLSIKSTWKPSFISSSSSLRSLSCPNLSLFSNQVRDHFWFILLHFIQCHLTISLFDTLTRPVSTCRVLIECFLFTPVLVHQEPNWSLCYFFSSFPVTDSFIWFFFSDYSESSLLHSSLYSVSFSKQHLLYSPSVPVDRTLLISDDSLEEQSKSCHSSLKETSITSFEARTWSFVLIAIDKGSRIDLPPPDLFLMEEIEKDSERGTMHWWWADV
jgi:hypothetical protein